MPTQREFAEHVGVKQPVVSDLVARGVLPKGGTLDEWRLAYCKHLRAQAAGRALEGVSDAAIAADKQRLMKAQADKTEHEAERERLEVEKLRGNLIPKEETIAEWETAWGTVRARMLALPSKATPLVLATRIRAEVEAILMRQVREALTEVADLGGDDEPSTKRDAEGAPGAEAAPEPDSKPVGKRKAPPKPRGQRRARPV